MLVEERRRRILEDIEREGVGKIPELSRTYNVSEMTIRRDLKALEEEGRLRATYGGAVRLSPKVEPRQVAELQVHRRQKQAIARYAAERFLNDGDIVVLEGSATVTLMVQYIQRDLTVVTNGLHTLNELQRLVPHATVIATGGILRETSLAFVGPHAERFFAEFHTQKLFLSATGLSMDAGLTDPNMIETLVKRAMISAAEQVIVLLDSSRLRVTSLTTVARTGDMHTLITDDGAPPDLVNAIRALGVDVHVVPVQ